MSKSLRCQITRKLQLGAYHQNITRGERDELVRFHPKSGAVVKPTSNGFGLCLGTALSAALGK